MRLGPRKIKQLGRWSGNCAILSEYIVVHNLAETMASESLRFRTLFYCWKTKEESQNAKNGTNLTCGPAAIWNTDSGICRKNDRSGYGDYCRHQCSFCRGHTHCGETGGALPRTYSGIRPPGAITSRHNAVESQGAGAGTSPRRGKEGEGAALSTSW